MQKYQILSQAGSGNFSNVYKARNRLTNEVVAIKQIKHSDDSEQLINKELQIITKIKHPNIIKVKQIITHKKDVSIVFEYMEETLLQLYQSSRLGINQNQVKCILFQAASALHYLHNCNIIHRDIKPENLLIDRKLALVKLIDFGLSKQDYLASTDYVATRWYRSPENLIGMRKSSTSMDIFALGCVTAELICQNPLFPGENTIDQLKKIFNLLGTPTMDNWPNGYLQMKRKGIMIPSKVAMSLKFVLPTASSDLLNLLDQMLKLNPVHRITAGQMLIHPFFQNVQKFIPELIYKQFLLKKDSFQKAKTPKLSVIYSSPIHQQKNSTSTSNLSTQTTHKYFKSPCHLNTPSRNNQQNNNSRLSIQTGKYIRDLSIDSKKSIPKYWQLKKTPMKLQISELRIQTPLQRTHSISQQEKAIRHYFSRQNLSTSSLSKSHKAKFFDSKGDSRYVTKVLQDQIKFNSRNTNSGNQIMKKDDLAPKQSQKYNVKYFRQANNNRGLDRFQNSRIERSQQYQHNVTHLDKKRNIGVSLQLNYISKNKIFKSKTNLNKPLLKGSYKRNY